MVGGDMRVSGLPITYCNAAMGSLTADEVSRSDNNDGES